jgi:hypothetical protein
MLYIESPDGPLENQIIGGVPVLADNWGFGIDELGRPYFDTGFASSGQQAYLRLIGGRVAIIGQSHFLGARFEGAPMRPNPPGHALNAGFVGRPLPPMPSVCVSRERPPRDARPLRADPPGWYERPRRSRDPRPLPRMPLGWYERSRVIGDARPLPGMPPNRGSGAGFAGHPLPVMPPNQAVDSAFQGEPMPANPPGRAPGADFTGTPMPPMPANRAAFGPLERTNDG